MGISGAGGVAMGAMAGGPLKPDFGLSGAVRRPGAPRIRVVCECVGAASAESLAAYGKTGAESIGTRRIISDLEIFRWRTNPHIAVFVLWADGKLLR